MKRSEKGFLTIELVVVIGVSAIITLGAAMTSAQMITGTQRNEDQLVAVNHAQKAGYWISQDMLSSQNITLGDVPGTSEDEFISLVWKDWQTGDTYDTRYWLVPSGSLQKMSRRIVKRDSDGSVTENRTILVADYISDADFAAQSGLWRLSIETQFGEKTVSREYQIQQRQ